ncbi:MAG: glycine cleavage T C-terminal barrel domain-containing protein, partial [Rhizobiaceae bacterium]
FVGELGWELHHPIEQQNVLFDALMEAGAEFGIKPFGIRAMTAMAIEKSYRLIPREMSIEYSAWESGLDRFVRLDKGDFLGREALVRLKEQGQRWSFVTLEVHGVVDADARGNEAIHKDGSLVGRATHGTYGWRVGKSLALAMVKPEVSAEGTELEISILGTPHKATVVGESPFDPNNAALRADG